MAQTSKVRGVSTRVYDQGGYTVVQYHATPVVKFNDREIILNSGGWHTSTTKARMNQAANQFLLGYQVFQKDYDWFVDIAGVGVVPFEDGMKIIR